MRKQAVVAVTVMATMKKVSAKQQGNCTTGETKSCNDLISSKGNDQMRSKVWGYSETFEAYGGLVDTNGERVVTVA